mgnify:CR=1 FL=1
MKKMQLETCCGTTCYMLGANRLLNIENEYVKLSFCSDFGIKLTQRAGSSISGIGHEGFTLLFTLCIQLLKGRAGHKHLASDLKKFQWRIYLLWN